MALCSAPRAPAPPATRSAPRRAALASAPLRCASSMSPRRGVAAASARCGMQHAPPAAVAVTNGGTWERGCRTGALRLTVRIAQRDRAARNATQRSCCRAEPATETAAGPSGSRRRRLTGSPTTLVAATLWQRSSWGAPAGPAPTSTRLRAAKSEERCLVHQQQVQRRILKAECD